MKTIIEIDAPLLATGLAQLADQIGVCRPIRESYEGEGWTATVRRAEASEPPPASASVREAVLEGYSWATAVIAEHPRCSPVWYAAHAAMQRFARLRELTDGTAAPEQGEQRAGADAPPLPLREFLQIWLRSRTQQDSPEIEVLLTALVREVTALQERTALR